eukprot:2768629-Ditylum_brightwellii.AAC.1
MYTRDVHQHKPSAMPSYEVSPSGHANAAIPAFASIGPAVPAGASTNINGERKRKKREESMQEASKHIQYLLPGREEKDSGKHTQK